MTLKRKLLLFLILIIFCNLTYSQKVILEYKVIDKDNKTVSFKGGSLSDKKIENSFESYLRKKNKLDIVPDIITDNINRKFIKLTIKDTLGTYRVLNEGYYSLFEKEGKNNPLYVIISEKDTICIKKEDQIIENNKYIGNPRYKEDLLYRGQLKSLAKDFPEMLKKADNLRYKEKELQSYIYQLNGKLVQDNNTQYVTTHVRRFLHFSGMAWFGENNQYINLSVLSSYYRLTNSTGLSFRMGVAACSFQHKGESLYSSYGVSYETDDIKNIGIPFLLNYDFTDWYLTPYFYFGAEPIITRIKVDQEYYHVFDRRFFTLDRFCGLGLKLRFLKNFYLKSEVSYSYYTFWNVS
jgi:hypothetical protein